MRKAVMMAFLLVGISCSPLSGIGPVPTNSPLPTSTSSPRATETEWRPSATPTSAEETLRKEEYALYNRILEKRYTGGEILCIVIEDHTTTGYLETEDTLPGHIRENLPEVTEELWSQFVGRNRESAPLLPFFDVEVPVILISAEEITAFFSEEGGGWEGFYETYPGAQGIMELSRAAFTPDMNQALVYAGNQGDYLAGAGFLLWMERQDGVWEIGQSVMVWIS